MNILFHTDQSLDCFEHQDGLHECSGTRLKKVKKSQKLSNVGMISQSQVLGLTVDTPFKERLTQCPTCLYYRDPD